MRLNLNQCRWVVGVLNNRKMIHNSSYNRCYDKSFRNCSSFNFFSIIFHDSVSPIWILNMVLCFSIIFIYVNHIMKLCGDVEEKPGLKLSSNQSFSICNWNLDSISAHNYIKLSHLRVYFSTHKFNVLCIYETYLDSDTSHDHLFNTMRSGVCINYSHSLAFRLSDLTTWMNAQTLKYHWGRGLWIICS